MSIYDRLVQLKREYMGWVLSKEGVHGVDKDYSYIVSQSGH